MVPNSKLGRIPGALHIPSMNCAASMSCPRIRAAHQLPGGLARSCGLSPAEPARLQGQEPLRRLQDLADGHRRIALAEEGIRGNASQRPLGRVAFCFHCLTDGWLVRRVAQLLANMVLQDRQHAGTGEAYHQGAIDRLERPEQLPPCTHDDVAIAQGGEVDA